MQAQGSMDPNSHILFSKYTKRVVLKSLIGRDDKGVGLIGQKVVVGGWVKFAKELNKKEKEKENEKENVEVDVVVEAASEEDMKGLSCGEILEMGMPIVRCVMKVFGASGELGEEKVVVSVQEGVTSMSPVMGSSGVVLRISDGSCVEMLKVVVESSVASPGKIRNTGTCILVEGMVQLPSVAGKHLIELKAEEILHLGLVDPENYPLSRKRVPLDSLRDWAHFRPRTTTVATITRISNSLVHATHTFFQNNAFLYIQVPVITTNDSHGFFEKKFHATTLLDKMMRDAHSVGSVDLEYIKTSIKDKSARVEELNRTNSNKEALLAAIQDLKKTSELASQLESKVKSMATTFKANDTGFSDDYFSRQAYLTGSGRLHLESYACALGLVYSFGPRFAAETSQYAKHAAEMWIVEAEMAFAEMEEAVACAVDFLKFLCKWVLERCPEDMKFVFKRMNKTIAYRLQSVISADFAKVSYTEAVDGLRQVTGRRFESKIEWGLPLTEEHKSYLADVIYKRPIIVYDYPRETKSFFVRLNDDGRAVAAFDVVIPKVGTLVRGSQSEERINYLSASGCR